MLSGFVWENRQPTRPHLDVIDPVSSVVPRRHFQTVLILERYLLEATFLMSVKG